MTDLLEQKHREITKRLNELAPMVEEYHRLESAATVLERIGGSTATRVAPRRRGPGRPRGSGKKAALTVRRKKPGRPKKVGRPVSSARKATTATRRRRSGRPKGSGTRATETLTLVRRQPGITIPELAAKMDIKQNYLYRVLPGLEQEGMLTKRGRGWHATAKGRATKRR